MSVASVPTETPACSLCDDFGFVEEGGYCSPCRCRLERERRARHALAEQAIGARFRHCDRSTWRGAWPLDAEADAWPAMQGRDPWALVLLGAPGVGKTHVATAIFRELLDRSPREAPLWITSEDASEAVRGEIGAEMPAHRRMIRRLFDADLLLFDDVGRERATPHSLELVRKVLHRRHLEMSPTIVTSNASSLDAFNVFDPALTSRLKEGTLVYLLEGEDQRGKTR